GLRNLPAPRELRQSLLIGEAGSRRNLSGRTWGSAIFKECGEMLKSMDWARGAALIAGLNLAIPQAMLFAADAPVTQPAGKSVKDINLTSGGDLTGKVVTSEGKGVDAAPVVISQAGKPVSKAVTTAKGEFKVTGLKTGVYQVSSGRAAQFVRVWPQDV